MYCLSSAVFNLSVCSIHPTEPKVKLVESKKGRGCNSVLTALGKTRGLSTQTCFAWKNRMQSLEMEDNCCVIIVIIRITARYLY